MNQWLVSTVDIHNDCTVKSTEYSVAQISTKYSVLSRVLLVSIFWLYTSVMMQECRPLWVPVGGMMGVTPHNKAQRERKIWMLHSVYACVSCGKLLYIIMSRGRQISYLCVTFILVSRFHKICFSINPSLHILYKFVYIYVSIYIFKLYCITIKQLCNLCRVSSIC